jgi:hypothetical protein
MRDVITDFAAGADRIDLSAFASASVSIDHRGAYDLVRIDTDGNGAADGLIQIMLTGGQISLADLILDPSLRRRGSTSRFHRPVAQKRSCRAHPNQLRRAWVRCAPAKLEALTRSRRRARGRGASCDERRRRRTAPIASIAGRFHSAKCRYDRGALEQHKAQVRRKGGALGASSTRTKHPRAQVA